MLQVEGGQALGTGVGVRADFAVGLTSAASLVILVHVESISRAVDALVVLGEQERPDAF